MGTALGVALALPPNELVDGDVADGDDVMLGVIKGVESGVGNPLSLPDKVAEGVALAVILALPPKETVESGVPDDEEVRLSVIDGVNGGVDEPLSLPEGVDVTEGITLDVILKLPPMETVDGGESDDEDVRLCVASGVGVIVNESELIIVAETLELTVGEKVLEAVDESEPVPALDGEAEDKGEGTALDVILALPPIETVDCDVVDGDGDCEEVGDVVASGVIDGDCEGVCEGVVDDVEVDESLDDCVCVGVKVLELVPDSVKVGVSELLAVIDELTTRVTVVVGVALVDCDTLDDDVERAIALGELEDEGVQVGGIEVPSGHVEGQAQGVGDPDPTRQKKPAGQMTAVEL